MINYFNQTFNSFFFFFFFSRKLIIPHPVLKSQHVLLSNTRLIFFNLLEIDWPIIEYLCYSCRKVLCTAKFHWPIIYTIYIMFISQIPPWFRGNYPRFLAERPGFDSRWNQTFFTTKKKRWG